RQLLTESLALSLFAGALGVGLAFVGIRALVGAAPPGIPRIGDTNVDLSVLGFALAVSVVAAVLSGLVPALRAARRDIESTLRDGRIASAARKGPDRTRTGLVVAEVALAFTLLVGAGLLIRSVHNLGRQPLGFEPRGVITARVTLPAAGYGTPDQLIETFRRIPRLLRERPGVRSAAVTSQAPLGPGGNGLLPEGRPDEPENRVFARLRIVTPNYFETMGIPLVRGRGFRESDVRGAARVMVVSEELARRAWPGVDPIGKRIICCEGSPDDPRWKTVIGVAGDVRSGGAAASLRPEFYLPIRQVPADAWNWIDRTMTVVARAANNPGALAGTFRDVLNEVDPTLPVYRARTMQQELRSSLAANRFQMTLLALLGVTGLVLAALGIYGVISYFVNLRTPEIGLRMALGATGLDVMSLLTRQGLTPVLAGLVIGLALALAATRLLSGLLFGVATADPITYAAVAIVFVVTATLAILFPARRAARIDPTRALEAK
ncbi:MAG: FtsX-like permease family protein, partial [Gemmatimonadetes bacterium]|nr:FtsX-like permease family protein [Gemmatimonadota bacterium]NIR76410.1 FtsX-like permease family protein [Candidatus Kutchimonas denitrificans]NIU78289.1 FtsX-like permease family protein [Gammaproteobacteria bacterium]NIS02377.1 FtsX-like permease family protein [Gemmatimonadota bacterium]NIT68264.1 FtsX-like permease family protein [Gemmatimonadota bacterium]